MHRFKSTVLTVAVVCVLVVAARAQQSFGSEFLTPKASEVDIDSGFIYGKETMTAFLITWDSQELVGIYDNNGLAVGQFYTGIPATTNAANRGRENKIKVISIGGKLAVARMHRLGTSVSGGVRMDFFRKVRSGSMWTVVKDPGFRYNAGSNRDNTFVQAGGDGGDIIMFARDTTVGTPYHKFPSAIRADEYRLSVGAGGQIIATAGQAGLKVTNQDYSREHPYADGDFLVGTKDPRSAANGAAFIMFRDANYRQHSMIEVTGERDPAKRFGNLSANVITLAAMGRAIEMIGTNTSPAGKFYGVGGLDITGSPYRFSSYDIVAKRLTEVKVDNADQDHDGRGDVLPVSDDLVMGLNLTNRGRIEGAIIDTLKGTVLQSKIVLSGQLTDYTDLAGEASYDAFGNIQYYLLLGASTSQGALLVWGDPR